MKKIFVVLGGIFAVLIVVAVVGFFILNHFGTGLDEESKSYVDANLPQIVKNWDVQELIKRASPELIAIVPKEKIEKLFNVFSERLGPLKEYKGSNGQSNMSVTTQEGKVITGAYVAEANFEKAPASIQFRIIKHGDNWQVLEFRVNSDALMP
ncbi:MAG: hypothetical protein NDI81_01830 [Desulfobacula sp.]|nr:hypothetical protein [Desulfobacula sp.]